MKSVYYCKERWPIYDFKKRPPKPANYQIVRKTPIKTEQDVKLHI